MSKTPKRLCLVFALSLCLICGNSVIAGDEWREVTPAELQMKTPKVEADADAEVIFWEVRVDDSNPENMVMKHYIRVKIFNDRGREKYSKIDIPYAKGIRIKNIMARVIKADGTIVDVTKADVFEREIAKTDKVKVKAKSFAVPNIEPGVIVEYKYEEMYDYGSAEDMRMTFQHDVPIENITYYFKPYENGKYLTFNMNDNKFIKDKNGFYRATMQNVPAIKNEPEMPPEDEVRSWLLLYYSRDAKQTSSDFWSRAGGAIVRTYGIKDTLKPGKEIKAAAAEITAGASGPDEQVRKIFDFCRAKVKNITFDTTMTDEQKEDIKANKSTGDTYKKLQGTSSDVNELFASLVTATGLEARLAFGGDRSQKFFNPSEAHESFIHFSSVAVKINGIWKYFDPGSPFVPYGMLSWNEESTSVLLLGYKDYITTETPYTNVDKTAAKRVGRFTLDEEGTLSGTVAIEYSGQLGYEKRMDNYKNSENKREENLKDEIKANMSAAEVSDITIENVTDSGKPFVYKYKVRIPNYAQKTGKRLFLQPGYFEYGKAPLFSTATRSYAVFFHYPWSESDDIEIVLPKGYALDNADAPAVVKDPSQISTLDIRMQIVQPNNVLQYKRTFYFGNNNMTLFPVASYSAVKNLFDAFYKSDSHSIGIKQK